MEKEKIDQFMMANAKFFPPMMVGQIKDKLAALGEDKETMLISTDWKNPTVGFLLLSSWEVSELIVSGWAIQD